LGQTRKNQQRKPCGREDALGRVQEAKNTSATAIWVRKNGLFLLKNV